MTVSRAGQGISVTCMPHCSDALSRTIRWIETRLQRPHKHSIDYGYIYEEPEAGYSVQCCYGNHCELFRQIVGIRAANPVGPYEYGFDVTANTI